MENSRKRKAWSFERIIKKADMKNTRSLRHYTSYNLHTV